MVGTGGAGAGLTLLIDAPFPNNSPYLQREYGTDLAYPARPKDSSYLNKLVYRFVAEYIEIRPTNNKSNPIPIYPLGSEQRP